MFKKSHHNPATFLLANDAKDYPQEKKRYIPYCEHNILGESMRNRCAKR